MNILSERDKVGVQTSVVRLGRISAISVSAAKCGGVSEKVILNAPSLTRPTPPCFNNDFDIPTTERARSRSSNAGCVYPGVEHRKRRLRYSTSSNRSRFRQHPLDHDSSPFPPNAQKMLTVNHRLSRTLWLTIRIMLTLAGIAAMCAKYSIGG
jgi:hypothetical protein